MSKYKAKRTEIDGIVFASKKEANRYSELRLLERAGEIRDLVLQPEFVLVDGFTDRKGKKHRPIKYIGDFQYRDDRGMVVEDTKGFRTEVYKLKKKLFMKHYPGIWFVEL